MRRLDRFCNPKALAEPLRRRARVVGRRLRVCMYDSDEPNDAGQQLSRKSKFFTIREPVEEVSWSYYWNTRDWEVSEGDPIREEKKVGCTGVWRVLVEVDDGSITAVEYVPAPLGLRFAQTNMTKLGASATRQGLFMDDRGWKLLDLVSFARDLGERHRQRRPLIQARTRGDTPPSWVSHTFVVLNNLSGGREADRQSDDAR